MPDDGFLEDNVTGASFLIEVYKPLRGSSRAIDSTIQIGRFMEVGGLTVESETEPLVEGGQNGFTRQLPGRLKYVNLTMKRGITQSDALIEWFSATSGEGFTKAGNKVTLRDCAVVLLGPGGKRLRSWTFKNAFPVKWTGPSFAATATDFPTEELEIAHEGFTAENIK